MDFPLALLAAAQLVTLVAGLALVLVLDLAFAPPRHVRRHFDELLFLHRLDDARADRPGGSA